MDSSPNILVRMIRRTFWFRAETGAPGPAAREEKWKPTTGAGLPRGPALDLPESNGFDDGIVNVLAEKVLLSWLRNRYQLLFPFAFDLKRLDRSQAAIVINAMVAAAEADGTFERKERTWIKEALKGLGATNDVDARLNEILDEPMPLNRLLAQINDVHTAAFVYAASLVAVDQRKAVNRHYLRYLAARLQLSEELVGSLEQRFRSSG